MAERVAVIDCGSNSTRLLVLGPAGALARDMRITRLSAGVDARRLLAPEALARTYAVLEEFRGRCEELGIDDGVVVATSAVRDAANREEFLAEASRRAGLRAVVLEGREEAAYSLEGALADLDEPTRASAIIDVGGGSTEVAWRRDGELLAGSMQLGCVRVTERALGSGALDEEREAAARAMIDAEVTRVAAEVPGLFEGPSDLRLIGLAGTVSTLVQLERAQATYAREAVHHQEVSREALARWRATLGAQEPSARLAWPGMVAGREDVIVAGLMVLEAVMDRFQVDHLLSSESDILDGVAAALRANRPGPVTMGG